MTRELTAQGDPRMLGGPPLDENPAFPPALRDYYRRFLAGDADLAGWINPADVQCDN